MCRRLPDGTYKYCPSRQPAGSRPAPGRVVEAIVEAAFTGDTSNKTVADLRRARKPGVVMTAEQKWGLWTRVADGSSVSSALQMMQATGWLGEFPELAALSGVPQSPHYHPEGDVLTHVGLAGDHMTRQCETDGITGDERTLLVLAATFHDLGKATHTHHEDDGRITSHGHAVAGVAPAHRLLAAMDAPQEFHDRIEPLIREHMCAVQSDGTPRRHLVVRLQRRLAPATLAQWVRVVNADHGGRGPASVNGYADEWLRVADEPEQVPVPAPTALVTGRDLIDAGLGPGEGFRPILAAARQAQDAGVFTDRDGAVAWLQGYLAT